jgi:putative phosphoesterase
MHEAIKTTSLRGVQTLGIVSDTHGHVANTQKAVRMLESFGVDAVLHCGDIGSDQIPGYFQRWPTHYVLGNVDFQRRQLDAAIELAGGVLHGRFAALRAAGQRIAMLHGDDEQRLRAELDSGLWDLLCHGHTHQATRHYAGRTLVVNPGALQRAYPPSIAILRLDPLEVTSITLE